MMSGGLDAFMKELGSQFVVRIAGVSRSQGRAAKLEGCGKMYT